MLFSFICLKIKFPNKLLSNLFQAKHQWGCCNMLFPLYWVPLFLLFTNLVSIWTKLHKNYMVLKKKRKKNTYLGKFWSMKWKICKNPFPNPSSSLHHSVCNGICATINLKVSFFFTFEYSYSKLFKRWKNNSLILFHSFLI